MITERLTNEATIKCLSDRPNFNGKTVNIEITGRCNEKCVYCAYYQNGTHDSSHDIDSAFFYRIMREAREIGFSDVGLYMKGEPLLNPQIADYIAFLKNIGFKYVYVSTNGLLCDVKKYESLYNAGLDSLKFSIAGISRDSFKRHHGVDGLDIVKKNIQDIYIFNTTHKKKCMLYVFFIVTRFNKHEVEKVKKELHNIVDELVFIDVIDNIVPLQGLMKYLAVSDRDRMADGTRRVPCVQLFDRAIIDEDGYLCSCCSTIGNLTRIKDLRYCHLADGLYSDAFIELRRQHMNNQIGNNYCKACIYGEMGCTEPFTTEYGFRSEELRSLNIESSIKERFGLH